MKTSVLTFCAVIASAVPVLADDRLPLPQDPVLERGLRVVAQGWFMRKHCDEVSMRYFKAIGLMNRLKDRATSHGYSEKEVRAYLDDKTHKDRVEADARQELEALGMDFDDPATFCPVAKAEIRAERSFGPYFRIR